MYSRRGSSPAAKKGESEHWAKRWDTIQARVGYASMSEKKKEKRVIKRKHLDIAVDNVAGVALGHRAKDALHHFRGLSFAVIPLTNLLPEGAPLHVLHHHVHIILVLEHVVPEPSKVPPITPQKGIRNLWCSSAQVDDVEAGADVAHDGDLVLHLVLVGRNWGILFPRQLWYSFQSKFVSVDFVHGTADDPVRASADGFFLIL